MTETAKSHLKRVWDSMKRSRRFDRDNLDTPLKRCLTAFDLTLLGIGNTIDPYFIFLVLRKYGRSWYLRPNWYSNPWQIWTVYFFVIFGCWCNSFLKRFVLCWAWFANTEGNSKVFSVQLFSIHYFISN